MTARRVGPYEVMRELGRGGMGVVYEVRDPALPRRLALKLILDGGGSEVVARFVREAELLARVRHPGVVAVHAVGRAPEGPYVVMDLVEGEPLARLAARGLDPARAAALVRALCDAVEALHAQGVLHRDLKPQNVIVRPDGAPVLLDFGVARDAASATSLTRTGQVLGTPRYMAPEQAEGKGGRPHDRRTDVYGLGAILFELLGGAPPFAEVEGGLGVLVAVQERAPRWPAAPEALGRVLRRAMARRPEDRPPTAAALGAALRGRPARRRRPRPAPVGAGEGAGARRGRAARRRRRGRRRARPPRAARRSDLARAAVRAAGRPAPRRQPRRRRRRGSRRASSPGGSRSTGRGPRASPGSARGWRCSRRGGSSSTTSTPASRRSARRCRCAPRVARWPAPASASSSRRAPTPSCSTPS
ncbi:MAG: serine/threonine protein kinase [Planctomycetes bacterium]|nr:serine/threonine protein kinase [Planctomycetota bacterium]